jgi:hypothetical protein
MGGRKYDFCHAMICLRGDSFPETCEWYHPYKCYVLESNIDTFGVRLIDLDVRIKKYRNIKKIAYSKIINPIQITPEKLEKLVRSVIGAKYDYSLLTPFVIDSFMEKYP